MVERSALDRAGHDTLDDVLLAQDVEEDDRNDRQHEAAHHGAHVDGTIAALEVLDRNRDRLVLVEVQRQVRQQVVIPHPHGLKDGHRDDRRLHDRHHDLEEDARHGGAVDHRRFFERLRDALDHAGEDEHGQTSAEAQVYEAQAPRGVQAQTVGEPRQREHEHLERYDHVEQEQRVERLGSPVVHAHDPPCAHRGAQQNQHNGADGDQYRPAEAGEEVRGLDAAHIVVEPDEGVTGRE